MTTERKTIKIRTDVYRRIKARRVSPREPISSVLERLLWRTRRRRKKMISLAGKSPDVVHAG